MRTLRFGSASPWIVWLALASACGPRNGQQTDAAIAPDAPDLSDAPPFADAVFRPTLMYVHTADTLYTIDDGTFSLNTIGGFALVGDAITDLAVTPDDSIYGISETKLYRVDSTTGAATYIADVPGLRNVGLTFLPDGTLLATDKSGGVRRVNPTNGQVTEVGTFGGGFATAGDLVAVADGTMYAISDKGPVGDELTNNWLLTVNTQTGAATPVGQINFGHVFGAAYAHGNVYAFTRDGEVIEIDRTNGQGTLRATHPVPFWGAAVTPLVVVE